MTKQDRIAESRAEAYTRKQLEVLGWDLRRVNSGGDVAEKQELRNHPRLRKLMSREAPEFVLFMQGIPRATIECKAEKEDIEYACTESKEYATQLQLKIAIGVAGSEETGVIVQNFYRSNGKFHIITHKGTPLTQILTKTYIERLIKSNKPDIDIDIPPDDRFWNEADKIHNLLRNSDIPKQNMAAYLGTIILAFSENQKFLSDPDFTDLSIVNTLAQSRLKLVKKPELQDTFRIPDPSSEVFRKLKSNLPLIVGSLQRLDVLPLLQTGVDILGKFFEQFLRYANDKKELGIVFTPRHIVDFMVKLADIKYNNRILDPCCGTGGFLVSAFIRMKEQLAKFSEKDYATELKNIQEERIYGTESESEGVIYGLACLNMLFRGDGKTNIAHKDCFTTKYPFKFDRILMNPPYSQSKKGTNGISEKKYVDYCLENLRPGGILCAIIPYSLMCDKSRWREALVKQHTIIASISVPAELFYPISAPAVIVVIKAHEPQNGKPTLLARIADDGFEIDRQKRSKVGQGQQEEILKEFIRWKVLYDRDIKELIDRPEFITTKAIPDNDELLEYVPEAHLRRHKFSKEKIEQEVDFVLRSQLCFQLKFAHTLLSSHYKQNTAKDANFFLKRLVLCSTDKSQKLLSDFMEVRQSCKREVYCEYGQKALHDKGWLKQGENIIIASGGADNGFYGFYEFQPAYTTPPIITCPSSGTICAAFVQEFPCSAYDNTLIFIPKRGTVTGRLKSPT